MKRWSINPRAINSVIDETGRCVASCNMGDALRPHEIYVENAANARLIAAAPEMLDALKNMVSAFGHYRDVWPAEIAAAWAAIQKAEGTR